jgi:hypothetical protein
LLSCMPVIDVSLNSSIQNVNLCLNDAVCVVPENNVVTTGCFVGDFLLPSKCNAPCEGLSEVIVEKKNQLTSSLLTEHSVDFMKVPVSKVTKCLPKWKLELEGEIQKDY